VTEGVDHCVILSNGAQSPGPWLGDKNDAMIGTGGCFAVALASLSILGGSKAAVCAKLEAQIDVQHMEFNEQRARKRQKFKPYDRARAGVEGEQWHPEVIRRALREERVERRATCSRRSLPEARQLHTSQNNSHLLCIVRGEDIVCLMFLIVKKT
jgi:hypothetical protein